MRQTKLSALLGAALIALSSPAGASSGKFEMQRSDGSRLDWSLDLPAVQTGRAGLVLIMQGSGCQPVTANTSLKLVRATFAEFAAVTADKYGVDPDTGSGWSAGADCPQAYHTGNTASQRVEDYRQILNSLSSAPWWSGQLILVGGSEGGDIAARLAALLHPDAVVLISTGGGATFGETVRASILGEMGRNAVPRDQWPDIDGMFARARENPQSAEVKDGHSYKFWADSIDYRAVDDMLKTAAPILLIHGTDDTSVPLYIARAAVDAFARKKRCNLTYWEKSGYTHGMTDPDGNNRMEEVLAQAGSWVRGQLRKPDFSPCMKP